MERIGDLCPGIRLEGRRVCAPAEGSVPQGEEERPKLYELSGWPQWEEHTRTCLINHLAAQRRKP
jgi:hypothetical protein